MSRRPRARRPRRLDSVDGVDAPLSLASLERSDASPQRSASHAMGDALLDAASVLGLPGGSAPLRMPEPVSYTHLTLPTKA